MLFTIESQMRESEDMCLLTQSHSSLFSYSFLLSIFSSISFSLSSLPLPPLYFHSDFLPSLLPLFQNRSNLSVECVQVCTYSGHRDGVWQVSHARNGLPVIGSASAGRLYTSSLTPRLWTKSLSMRLVSLVTSRKYLRKISLVR